MIYKNDPSLDVYIEAALNKKVIDLVTLDVRDLTSISDYFIICSGRSNRQVQAIAEQDGVAVVDQERCIGCGLCVTGCPNDVVKLQRKPDVEIVRPPADYAAWEHERLLNRGLAE